MYPKLKLNTQLLFVSLLPTSFSIHFTLICGHLKKKTLFTYCCSIFPHQPAVVAEQREHADEEHCGHKEKEEHVELCTRLLQFVLRKEEGRVIVRIGNL